MLFMILFFLAVIGICAATVWTRPDGSPIIRRRPRAAGPLTSSPVVQPESLEGVLVGQLLAGHITREQYVRSLEGLAARDDERHPMAVPPEIGPASV